VQDIPISPAKSQDDYRRQLAACWQIPLGANILEVGCGQGDMTSVLAESADHVTAVDIADRSYGAPLTLGAATDLIKGGPLGHRIEFLFGYDILCINDIEGEPFDYCVLAHCSWYFSSEDELVSVFTKLRTRCRFLCFAEWDLEPQALEQVPHLLAVLIQGQVESFKSSSSANVRTPFSRQVIETLLLKSGWKVARSCSPDTGALQDANWEIDICMRNSLREAQNLNMPPNMVLLLASQVDLMERLKEKIHPIPLGSYALVATLAR
jgi:SAM-dependent methyltransferase